MFVHSDQTQGAMLELKSRKKQFQYVLNFHQKMGKMVAAKLIPSLQAFNLPPLAQEVDLLPTQAEVFNISLLLHCFDVALLKQHVNSSG